MAAHLPEPAVVGAPLAHEYRVHRRLHVIVDAARAGALVEGERAVVRVEHHLLRLARVGPNERHPAVAEPHVRDLHRHRDAGDQHHLVAPVELVGLARIEAQRHEGCRRSRAALAPPARSIAPDGIIPALVAETAEVLIDPQQRHPVPAAPRRIRGQQPVKLVPPGAELRLRLDVALVIEGGLVRAQNLPHNLPRHLQLAADLLDRLPLNKVRPAYFGDRLHNQHPNLGSRYLGSTYEPHRQGGPFWKPITPETGSLLRASPHLGDQPQTASSARARHSLTSSSTASVTQLIRSGETSSPVKLIEVLTAGHHSRPVRVTRPSQAMWLHLRPLRIRQDHSGHSLHPRFRNTNQKRPNLRILNPNRPHPQMGFTMASTTMAISVRVGISFMIR
jgi:hypothetical protein